MGRGPKLCTLVAENHKKEATRDSSFNLVYGTNVVLLVETTVPSLRVVNYEEKANNELC